MILSDREIENLKRRNPQPDYAEALDVLTKRQAVARSFIGGDDQSQQAAHALERINLARQYGEPVCDQDREIAAHDVLDTLAELFGPAALGRNIEAPAAPSDVKTGQQINDPGGLLR